MEKKQSDMFSVPLKQNAGVEPEGEFLMVNCSSYTCIECHTAECRLMSLWIWQCALFWVEERDLVGLTGSLSARTSPDVMIESDTLSKLMPSLWCRLVVGQQVHLSAPGDPRGHVKGRKGYMSAERGKNCEVWKKNEKRWGSRVSKPCWISFCFSLSLTLSYFPSVFLSSITKTWQQKSHSPKREQKAEDNPFFPDADRLCAEGLWSLRN